MNAKTAEKTAPEVEQVMTEEQVAAELQKAQDHYNSMQLKLLDIRKNKAGDVFESVFKKLEEYKDAFTDEHKTKLFSLFNVKQKGEKAAKKGTRAASSLPDKFLLTDEKGNNVTWNGKGPKPPALFAAYSDTKEGKEAIKKNAQDKNHPKWPLNPEWVQATRAAEEAKKKPAPEAPAAE